MLKLMWLAAVIGSAPPTELDPGYARWMREVRQAKKQAGPPRLGMHAVNYGDPGELRLEYAYIEKDEPLGEFDMRVVVTDPASGAVVARQTRHLVAMLVFDGPTTAYSEPARPGPEDGQRGYFRLEFRRKLPPGKYRVTVSAGGVIAMTRDYVVRGR